MYKGSSVNKVEIYKGAVQLIRLRFIKGTQ